MKKITINPRSHQSILAEELKNPAFKKAYDDLEFEFAIIDAMILARSKRGMTQAKLAKKLGTKQSAIARLESGRGNPTLAFVQRLANVLNLDLKLTPRYAKR
ncbi:MAG: helix-turn-helix transcriptional regulator [Patescibacteria group bacterium]